MMIWTMSNNRIGPRESSGNNRTGILDTNRNSKSKLNLMNDKSQLIALDSEWSQRIQVSVVSVEDGDCYEVRQSVFDVSISTVLLLPMSGVCSYANAPFKA